MFDQPKELNAHIFSCCDTIGGQAYRSWTMLFKHQGVFIGFSNHKWVVKFSSDPFANWSSGSQNSRVNGDPWPRSENSRLINYSELPQEAQPLAEKWYKEAVEICIDRVVKQEEKKTST